MSDIYKEFGVDFLRTRYAGPSAAEMKMAQEIKRLRAEVLEQARLLGMSGEREAKLLARVEVLRKELTDIAEYCDELDATVSTISYAARRALARTAEEDKP